MRYKKYIYLHKSLYFTFIFKISLFFFGYFGNFYYFCNTVSYLLYDMTANSPIQKSLKRVTLC